MSVTNVSNFQTAMQGLKSFHTSREVTAATLPEFTKTVTSFGEGVNSVLALNGAPDKAKTALNTDLAGLKTLATAATQAVQGGAAFRIDDAADNVMKTAHADAERAIKLLNGQ